MTWWIPYLINFSVEDRLWDNILLEHTISIKQETLKKKRPSKIFRKHDCFFPSKWPTKYWNCKFQKALDLVLVTPPKLSYPSNELYIFKAYIYLKWMLTVFRGHQEVQRGLQHPKVLIFFIDFITMVTRILQ